MFGFGNKDKDKLEDNMEEIKEMVSQGEAGVGGQQTPEENSESPQKDGFNSDTTDNFGESSNQQEQGFENGQGFDDTQSFEDNPRGFQDAQEQPSQEQALDKFESQAQGSEPSNEQGRTEESFDQKFEEENEGFGQQTRQEPNSGQDTKPNTQVNNQERKNQEPRTRNRKTGEGRQPEEKRTPNKSRSSGNSSLEKQIPKPAETKELNVPEIEKGPLFIRQEKFESAVRMIEEMRYLSNEIESVVNRLEQGIQQDRETEREAKEILHSLEEDRSGVQNIVSPKED